MIDAQNRIFSKNDRHTSNSCLRFFSDCDLRWRAAEYPALTEGDYVVPDFKFVSGEMMPELRLHYRTLGKADKDAQGIVRNAVFIMHGTTGSGAQFIRPEFAGELFGAGQPLDAAKFSSFCRTGSGTGSRASPATGCTQSFRVMPIEIWWRRSFVY